MRSKILGIFGLMVFLAFANLLQAQTKTLPTNPTEFIEEFTKRIEKTSSDKTLHKYLESFKAEWEVGKYTPDEQQRFVMQVNIMLSKNYSIGTEVLAYTRTFRLLKADDAHARVGVPDFFTVTDSCILLFDRKTAVRYFGFMETFLADGAAFKTSNASWTFSNTAPKLGFTTVMDPEKGRPFSFPYLDFEQTDLIYKSKRDSTVIHNTRGRVNVRNRVWKAGGGKIDWAKMNLDPSTVWVDLYDYQINLNYSYLNIDTVLFHYEGLLDKPLKGEFKDINKGHGDINKANYPFFHSYEGDVVIENLVPNVTYEGGFSLKGIRKVGSWYTVEREVVVQPDPPEPESEEEDEGNEGEDDPWAEDESNDYFDWDDIDWGEVDEQEYYEDESDWDEDAWEDPEEDLPVEDSEEVPFVEETSVLEPEVYKETVVMKASLTINRNNGQKIITLRSMEFVLDLENLMSKNNEVTLYLHGEDSTDLDSIFHPGLDLLYVIEDDEIFLMRTNNSPFAHTPFSSSHHNYALYFKTIQLKREEDKILFTSLIDKENEIGAIESTEVWKLERMRQFKGVMAFNPIGGIERYMYYNPGAVITPQAVCDHLKRPDEYEKMIYALKNLQSAGFITYNPVTQEITPLEKLHKWAKAARDKKDYDAIQIISSLTDDQGKLLFEQNGMLNLETRDMEIYGVERFSLSDSQYIWVEPANRTITATEDRNLEFGGLVEAGKLNFERDDSAGAKSLFTFDYENYKINCDSVILKFVLRRDVRVNDITVPFTPLQKALRNTQIEGVTGAIYINLPFNKNGMDVKPEYSIFDSYTNSYIYWAKDEIHDGVYTKDKLYFSIDPFVLDSLETFDESKLTFTGEFYSSEIFPRIKQQLVVMEDYTLGMKYITEGDTGMPAYEGKGRFYNEIRLDGTGLEGDGKLEFMHTTAESDSFQFFFDSVKAVTNNFYMPGGEREGVYYPEIKASKIKYKWLTKRDEVELETVDGEPIVLFEGNGTFEGKLVITPEGLKGNGTLRTGDVAITSEDINFQEFDLKTESGTFAVHDPNDPTKTVFQSNGVSIEYDVTKQDGSFQSTSEQYGQANSQLPDLNYNLSLDKGTYNKETGKIQLEAISPKLKDNYFYSTDPKQDSLSFYAKGAVFDLNTQSVDIEGVPYIYVADAKVIPNDGKALLKSDGYLQTFRDAVIEANMETKYHKIYDATVDITGRNDYDASGKLDYIPVNDQDQFVNLESITVTDENTTFARGVIPEEQNFFLTDRILFKGRTELQAENRFMRFTGQVKIDVENEVLADAWFNFDEVVNPDSVFIPINEELLKSPKGQLFVGLHYIPRNRIYYSTFLELKKNKLDLDLMLAEGGLTFDRTSQSFKIGPKEKIVGDAYKGTVVSYNDQVNLVTCEGYIKYPFAFVPKTSTVAMAGRWSEDKNQRDPTINTDLVLGVGFDAIPKEAWGKLGEQFKLTTALNDNVDFGDRKLLESLAELYDDTKDDKKIKKFAKDVENVLVYTDIKIARDLPYSLLLSGVDFSYSTEYKSLWSNGEIGLIGMNGEPINKKVNAKIEYNMGRMSVRNLPVSDTLSIYIEVDELTWVYFNFYDQKIETWSSDLLGYNAVLTTEQGKRKKEEGYRFVTVTDDEKDDCLGRFINRYIWGDLNGGGGGFNDSPDPDPEDNGETGEGEDEGGETGDIDPGEGGDVDEGGEEGGGEEDEGEEDEGGDPEPENNAGTDTDGDGVVDAEDECPEVKGDPLAKGCPDSDLDGTPDKDDRCPEIPGDVQGCPDSDGDGVSDADDLCPSVPGVVENNGCPPKEDKDTDGDGVLDKDDACPEEAGPEFLGGCPDTDSDGVADKDDQCPEVPGDRENNGCPQEDPNKDTDGDGVADKDDACPEEAGPEFLGGCPDTDSDGVADKDDQCPEVPGDRENNGCPQEEGGGN